MSNIDNLGRYGEFSRNADEYIRQLQSDAVDDAALRQHVEERPPLSYLARQS